MTQGHFVRLPRFEGPLDLLLHLVKVHELDIFDIDVLELTAQYLEHLRIVDFRDLTEAAAFLEMAAALCEMKSTQLLPDGRDPETDEGEGDTQAECSPADLQRRLQQLETFRTASEHLAGMASGLGEICSNSEWSRLESIYADSESPLTGDTATLLVLYEQMMGTLVDRRPVRVQAVKETLTVAEAIGKIREHVEKLRFLLFQDLYARFESRYELVANVLGVLQLVRDRELRIHQETDKGPLWLYTDETAEVSSFAEQRASNEIKI